MIIIIIIIYNNKYEILGICCQGTTIDVSSRFKVTTNNIIY